MLFVFISNTNCTVRNNFPAKYYSDSNSDRFINHIKVIDDNKLDTYHYSNSIFLIIYETQCGSCLSELMWWEENQKEFNEVNIYALTISKYESFAKSFLKSHKITLPALYDTSSIFLANDIIPYVPIKVYINHNLEIEAIHDVDAGKNLDSFLKIVNRKI